MLDLGGIKAEAAQAVALEGLFDSHPGVLRKVRLSWVGDSKGRGMVATEELRKGDVFLSVPHTLLYCCDGCEGGLGGDTERDPPLSNVHRLVAKVLHDKQQGVEDALLKQWLAMLPQEFTSIVTWGDDAIQQLGTRMRVAMATKLKADITAAYKKLCSAGIDSFTFEEFCWAHCVVHTRGFSFRGGDWTLLPYADMFNHHPDGCDRFEFVSPDGDRGSFAFTADRDYAEGDEVLLKYNSTGGWEQLVNYGFLDQYARNATFPLCVALPEVSEAVPPSDVDILKRRAAEGYGMTLCLTRKGPTKDTMKALRLRYLSTRDCGGDAAQCRLTSKVSLENEWNCWMAVKAYCKTYLELFSFTPEDDANALRDTSLSLTCRLAVQLRATDRSILRKTCRMAQRMQLAIAKQMILLCDDIRASDAAAAKRFSQEIALLRRLR